MSNVAVIGMGRLGLPVALSIENKGHSVVGVDIRPEIGQILESRVFPHQEAGVDELLKHTKVKLTNLYDAIDFADIVFVPIQTPALSGYEGETPLPKEKADYDYSYLIKGVEDIARAANDLKKHITLVVISTVLPGTTEKYLKPLFNKYIHYAYEPFFIGMGTTIQDFEHPEFVLLGSDESPEAMQTIKDFWKTITDAPILEVPVKDAELIKVLYNVFLSSKISFITSAQELCHKVGANVDNISKALTMATDRILSPKYLWGGQGDGGPCFIPQEIVFTEMGGPQPIKTITAGQKVLTRDGTFKKVIKVWERIYEGELITIKARGLPVSKATPNHPFLVNKDGRGRTTIGKRITNHKIIDKLTGKNKKRADELTMDHLLGWPHIKELNNDWHFKPSFLELAGWYLSEGSAELSPRRGRLKFTLHKKEIKDAKRIVELLKKEIEPKQKGKGWPKITHTSKDNKRDVRVSCQGLTKRLVSSFGRGSGHKYIPADLLWGDIDESILLLKGLIRGDGHNSQDGVTYSTISEKLAWGVFITLHRLNLKPSLKTIPPCGMHKRAYEVSIDRWDDANILRDLIGWPLKYKQQIHTKYADDGEILWRPIYRLGKKKYSGKVYNLWVEGDHTYVVGTGITFNCHPKDITALCWVAEQNELSYNWFESIMLQRENYIRWLADLVEQEARELETNQVVICGMAFKKNINLTVGSPSLLLKNFLEERGFKVYQWDPLVNPDQRRVRINSLQKRLFVISMNHDIFKKINFLPGAVVVDPWGIIREQEGVKLIRIGRK